MLFDFGDPVFCVTFPQNILIPYFFFHHFVIYGPQCVTICCVRSVGRSNLFVQEVNMGFRYNMGFRVHQGARFIILFSC